MKLGWSNAIGMVTMTGDASFTSLRFPRKLKCTPSPPVCAKEQEFFGVHPYPSLRSSGVSRRPIPPSPGSNSRGKCRAASWSTSNSFEKSLCSTGVRLGLIGLHFHLIYKVFGSSSAAAPSPAFPALPRPGRGQAGAQARRVAEGRRWADHGARSQKGSALLFVIRKNKFAASICLDNAWTEPSHMPQITTAGCIDDGPYTGGVCPKPGSSYLPASGPEGLKSYERNVRRPAFATAEAEPYLPS